LKPKHAEALVKDWLAQGLGAGTTKNLEVRLLVIAPVEMVADRADEHRVVDGGDDLDTATAVGAPAL